jgi:hypothetical protein
MAVVTVAAELIVALYLVISILPLPDNGLFQLAFLSAPQSRVALVVHTLDRI